MDELNFNTDNMPEIDDYSILKPGTYNCIVSEAAVKTSNNQNNPKYLNVNFEVEDGPEMGKKFWVSLNYNHSNETTKKIALQHVRLLMESLGIKTTRSTNDLIGARAHLTVAHRSYTGNDGQDHTAIDVKKWERPERLSQPSLGTPAPAASSTTTPPWKRG